MLLFHYRKIGVKFVISMSPYKEKNIKATKKSITGAIIVLALKIPCIPVKTLIIIPTKNKR